jgi:SHS2 domain-containing protein
MKPYEFLDHTADEKFRAYGETIEESFSNAALATYAIMTDVSKVKPKLGHVIDIKASKMETLLYEFLEEFIFLTDTEAFLLSEVTTIKIKNNRGYFELSAEVKGDNAKGYEISTQIKSPTYHEMEIGEIDGLKYVQVVVDI